MIPVYQGGETFEAHMPWLVRVLTSDLSSYTALSFMDHQGLAMLENVSPCIRKVVVNCTGWVNCAETEFGIAWRVPAAGESANAARGNTSVLPSCTTLSSLKALLKKIAGACMLHIPRPLVIKSASEASRLDSALERAACVHQSHKERKGSACFCESHGLVHLKFWAATQQAQQLSPDDFGDDEGKLEDSEETKWNLSTAVVVPFGVPGRTVGCAEASAVRLNLAWSQNKVLVSATRTGDQIPDPGLPILPSSRVLDHGYDYDDDDLDILEERDHVAISLFTVDPGPLLRVRDAHVVLNNKWTAVSGLCAATMPADRLAAQLRQGLLLCFVLREAAGEQPICASASTYNLHLEAPAPRYFSA